MTILEECLGESTDCAFVPIFEKKSAVNQILEPYDADLR